MGGSGEKSPRMDLGKKMQLTNFVTISFVLGNTTYWGLETAVFAKPVSDIFAVYSKVPWGTFFP